MPSLCCFRMRISSLFPSLPADPWFAPCVRTPKVYMVKVSSHKALSAPCRLGDKLDAWLPHPTPHMKRVQTRMLSLLELLTQRKKGRGGGPNTLVEHLLHWQDSPEHLRQLISFNPTLGVDITVLTVEMGKRSLRGFHDSKIYITGKQQSWVCLSGSEAPTSHLVFFSAHLPMA